MIKLNKVYLTNTSFIGFTTSSKETYWVIFKGTHMFILSYQPKTVFRVYSPVDALEVTSVIFLFSSFFFFFLSVGFARYGTTEARV